MTYLFNFEEAAEYTRTTPAYVRYLVKSKRLASVRLGHRTTRIRKEDLDAFIAAQVEATKAGSA